jgi:hypothetical protein
MFHTASPASNFPARSPMRGSGLGGAADIAADDDIALGDGDVPAVVDVCAHAATATAASVASASDGDDVSLTRGSPWGWGYGARESNRTLASIRSIRAISVV